MLIFSRYLIKNYLKVLILSVFSFIAILLVSRLEEVAHFAAIGAPWSYLALFIFYQIPYILPIAIPISCLISAMILFQRLSHTRELMALRALGLSLKQVLAPLLVTGVLLACINFYICSELATTSHLATREMAHKLTSANPLILLQSAKISKLKGAYVQMDPVQNGQEAHDLLIGLKNASNDRINLCLAKEVKMDNEKIKARHVTLISSVSSSSLDHLIIENQESLIASAPEFSHLLRKKGWRVANDHLKWNLLRVRKTMLADTNTRDLAKYYSEVSRRLSLGIAAFTFTLMGISFGTEISRNQTIRGMCCVLLLTATTLITFFVGKQLDHLAWIASSLFFLPHLLIILASIWKLSRITRGIE